MVPSNVKIIHSSSVQNLSNTKTVLLSKKMKVSLMKV